MSQVITVRSLIYFATCHSTTKPLQTVKCISSSKHANAAKIGLLVINNFLEEKYNMGTAATATISL